MRAAAAEQADEQLAEMLVDLGEGGEQALAPLAIECRDALAQLGDGAGQILALANQVGQLFLDLDRFRLGDQIDRAHIVALADQALEPSIRRGDIGQLLVGLDLGGC